MLVRNASPRGPLCFRYLMLGPCELLFLLCFIASWTRVVVSVMLYPCILCVAPLMDLFVLVPYVDALTVMCVLLFVCMLRECEGDGNTGVVVGSAGHVGGTRGSGIVSSPADMLGMSVCLARSGVEGEGRMDERIGFVLTNPVGIVIVLDVCLCLGYGDVCEEWVGRVVVLCLCEL